MSSGIKIALRMLERRIDQLTSVINDMSARRTQWERGTEKWMRAADQDFKDITAAINRINAILREANDDANQ